MTAVIKPGLQVKWETAISGKRKAKQRGYVVRLTGVRALVHKFPHGGRVWLSLDRLAPDEDVARLDAEAPLPEPVPRPPRAPDKKSAQIRDMTLAGRPAVEIAREVGLCADTVKKRLRAMGMRAVGVSDGRLRVPEKYKWMESHEKQSSW